MWAVLGNSRQYSCAYTSRLLSCAWDFEFSCLLGQVSKVCIEKTATLYKCWLSVTRLLLSCNQLAMAREARFSSRALQLNIFADIKSGEEIEAN